MARPRSYHALKEETDRCVPGEAHAAPPPSGWVEIAADVHERPRLKAGLIALSNDPTPEADLHAVFARYPMSRLATQRVHSPPFSTLGSLAGIGDRLADAARGLMPDDPLDVVAYACTSGSIVLGSEAVAETIRQAIPGAKVTNPMDAALAAFAALGIARIALLTPYTGEVNRVVAAHLERQGIGIAGKGFFRCFNDDQRNRVTEQSLRAAAVQITEASDCDALFISCTALPTVRLVDRLEQEIGRPVITSNQALAWNMLRLGGETEPTDGFGRLLHV